MFGDKGMSFTLEAVISGLIVISALLFFFNSPPTAETYTLGLSNSGYNCLYSIDEKGTLRENAMNDDYSSIENDLDGCLSGLNYTVQICRSSCTSGYVPENKTIVVSNYYIAGEIEPDPIKIKLSMWLK